MIYFGCLFFAPSFIRPCSPYFALSAKVFQIISEAVLRQKLRHRYMWIPTIYMIITRMRAVSSPPAKTKKVLSFQTFEFNRPPNSFINMILHSNFIERMNAILLQPQSGKYMPQTSSPPFYSCQGLQMKIYYTLSPLQSVRRLHRSHRSAWLQDQNSWLPFGLLLIYLLHHFLGLGAHFGRKSKWQILTEFLVFDFSCFITFLVRNPRLCGLGNKGVTGMK